MDDTVLVHYGVKGMRWGVKRTPAQLGRRAPAKQAAKRAKERPKDEDEPSGQTKKTVRELSDAELKEAIGRLELEKRYRELSKSDAPKTNEGKRFVENVLKKSGENIATQFTTYVMGSVVNKVAGSEIVNPKKGQKDK